MSKVSCSCNYIYGLPSRVSVSVFSIRIRYWLHRISEYLFYDGYFRTASSLVYQVLEAQKRVPGPGLPDTLGSTHSLAAAYISLGWNAEGAQMHEEILEARKRTLGAEHPDTLWSMHSLTEAYDRLGRLTEAVKVF